LESAWRIDQKACWRGRPFWRNVILLHRKLD